MMMVVIILIYFVRILVHWLVKSESCDRQQIYYSAERLQLYRLKKTIYGLINPRLTKGVVAAPLRFSPVALKR